MFKTYYFKTGISLALVMCMYFTSFGQDTSVSGKVSGEDGGLPGVNVLIEGTTVGTVTDYDGNYTISVPSDESTLVFSSVGYISQTVVVGNRSVIDLTMEADVTVLSELVVTALGVERDVKALNYSVTEVDGENFKIARENNVGNSLAGRVAGVNVTNVSSGPAGSSRVIIRGNKSLQGQNQPLYVVDGVPMDNSQFDDIGNTGDSGNGQAGVWSGADNGDGLSNINPDDIESITVLKGAAASALYGSRGGNGVINITTKKGTKRKGVGIEFNTNYVVSSVINRSDLQQKYGSGNYVNGVPTAPTSIGDLRTGWLENSWGPRLGSGTYMGVDGVTRPYEYAGDNWKRFYNTGSAWTNTLAITGGGDKQTFRIGIADLRSKGIIPNNGYDRLNLSIQTNGQYGKLTIGAKALYSHEKADNRPTISDSPANAVQAVWRRPPNVNIDDLVGDPNKPGAIPEGTDQALLDQYQRTPGQELLPSSNNNWGPNPWWVTEQHKNDDTKDRIFASANARFDITDFLYVSGRATMDYLTRRGHTLYPEGSGDVLQGTIQEDEFRVREVNLDWMLGFDDTFGKFDVNVFLGGNQMIRSNERIRINGSGFAVPFFPFINNATNPTYNFGFQESGINSIFASAEIGYNGVLFLTGTARQDWFSVLNADADNSVFYPSVGASWVFSESFSSMPSWLNFGKARVSWGQSGIVTIGPYDVNNTYSLRSGEEHGGRSLGIFSQSGGTRGNFPNPFLIPAISTEIEAGIDLRMFDNRLGLDFTYYDQKTENDIVRSTIGQSTGFGSTDLNVGLVSNKGVEILLTGTPIKSNLVWDVSFNIARNTSKVEALAADLTFIEGEESRTRTTRIRNVLGGAMSEVWGWKHPTDDQGNKIYLADGRAAQGDAYEYLGNGLPDWTGGLNNSFTFKGINLSFLIDFKIGGVIHSGTNQRLTEWGLHQQSVIGREGETPLHITGVLDTDGSVVDRDLTPDEARNYWGSIGGRDAAIYIRDAGFGKLRQLTLGYSLPGSVISDTPFTNITISFVGRNLAILWSDIENVDPEAGYSSNAAAQGLDYFGMPSTREYGFNLKLGF